MEPLMLGQPSGEIWVPMGREGVVGALGGSAVSSGYVNVGGGGGMLSGKRDCPEADNGAAVPVRRLAG